MVPGLIGDVSLQSFNMRRADGKCPISLLSLKGVEIRSFGFDSPRGLAL
jgi:hypothetical protein